MEEWILSTFLSKDFLFTNYYSLSWYFWRNTSQMLSKVLFALQPHEKIVLALLHKLCYSIFFRFCEQLYKSLGFDWLLLFLNSNIHKETVIRGVRMLCRMLTDVSALNKFQSGAANGYWLFGSEALTAKKATVAAGK